MTVQLTLSEAFPQEDQFYKLDLCGKHLSVTEWQGRKVFVLYLRLGGFLGSFEMKKDLHGMNKP